MGARSAAADAVRPEADGFDLQGATPGMVAS
jgi:hypothetical protein